ncbi:chitin synthase III catalytic subunit [Rhodofomes roseus]|uniref:Chitin synthase III catalytic subunit n=1 Tax=Rhodofomes roseus TaxID=34475 RepID=A0ABQ8K0M2_9APHY|nr:chitin synthase III catalytic subunit [Rhodofomes roseus]KAH9830140.1 chitin synthase III catalytic subunit [Rhodofomes roseus]
MTQFGDFAPLCHTVPSYPWCNLFYRQIVHANASFLANASANATEAPVGVNPQCGILRVGADGSIGNVANIVVCGVSILFTALLIVWTSRRRAAVGRVELRQFLVLYLLTLPFQLVTTGAFLEQGSTALTAVTAVHAGLVAATFWALLGNAIVSTQVVEDGTLSSLIPFNFFLLAFFAVTTYIALDVGFSLTHVFGPSNPLSSESSVPLFVLTSIWPGAATIIYFLTMIYVVLAMLNEVRPVWYFVLAMVIFVLSQLDYFLLSKVICKGTSAKVDGSFVATILETAAVGVLYLAWRSITEETWDDDVYYPR